VTNILHTSSTMHKGTMCSRCQVNSGTFTLLRYVSPDVICIHQKVADTVQFYVKYLVSAWYTPSEQLSWKGQLFHQQLDILWDGSIPRTIANLCTYTSQFPQTIIRLLSSVRGGELHYQHNIKIWTNRFWVIPLGKEDAYYSLLSTSSSFCVPYREYMHQKLSSFVILCSSRQLVALKM
jgi:hypothetical protein